MTNSSRDWLPALIEPVNPAVLDEEFLQRVFQRYRGDFIDQLPTWGEGRFALKRYPERGGWPATFWHLVTEGPDEESRQIDLARCQRIAWPRVLIDEYTKGSPPSTARITHWRNLRGGRRRLLISTLNFDYVVVLEVRREYVLLWTAYPTQRHTASKLKREHDLYWEQNVE